MDDPTPDTSERQLVVVGSSAGGIEALLTLVGGLPEDLPAAVVLAQHLDPNRPSHLDRILSSRTALPVENVRDNVALAAGTIYVVPPDRHVEVRDGHLDLLPDGDRPAPSINTLLSSAADAYGERLIAVILTGSGSDGADGAVRVKEAGGTVVIQDPESAAYPSMPRSLPPTIVEFSEPIADIAPLLGRLCQPPSQQEPEQVGALPALLNEIQARQGIDFSSYKPQTLLRRLDRRLIATGSPDIDTYRHALRSNPEEERTLVSSFLIKVTRFFRDPALFEYLRTDILPGLIDEARASGRELRIWSAGCATGEEPYSLALLVAELAGSSEPLAVRIFATDLDEDAIAVGRRGVYSPTSIAGVPPDLIDRYFLARDGGFEVRQSLRSMVVFGQHDLGQRPPFPNIDLILCRNVLIYFSAALQQQALDAFAYSLRDGGYLSLGTSETPRPLDDLFQVHDRRHRIFRRHGARPAPRPTWPSSAARPSEPAAWLPRTRSPLNPAASRIEGDTLVSRPPGSRFEKILRQLDSGIALIDRRYDIGFINGAARRLLGIHGVAIDQDFIHLAQRIPSTPLRAAIDRVLRGEGPVQLDPIVVTETATGDVLNLAVVCHPEQTERDGPVDHVLIVIEDVTDSARGAATSTGTIEQLETSNQALRDTIEQLTTANRELLGANRELSDTADELREQGEELRLAYAAAQVASEEIETLNEELQASNEELETLNEETQATLEELNATNDELSARSHELEGLAATQATERSRLAAILESIGEAVVVVDASGKVIRNNPSYDTLLAGLGKTPADADPFADTTHDAGSPLRRAASGEEFLAEFTLADGGDGPRWLEATGSPLRGDGQVGGVLVIRETTDRQLRRLEEQFVHIAGHELRSPLTALQGYLQLARRRVDRLDDERLARHLDAAMRQVQRQTQLINQLMDVGRLRTGKLNLTLELVDLVTLTTGVVETMRVVAPDWTFDVGTDADTGTLMIEGDEVRLEQVLLNVLSNAVKHAPDSRRVDVRLHRIADDAVIEIQDFGPGIAAGDLVRIFDLLAQIDPPDQASRSGLGLGLYISREIVQAHDGTMTVQSEPGTGATFTIRLPLNDTTAP